ncbi:MAG TPA: TonB-dependent receptor [Alphaproteobacteria bacterium]|nr:TonB-dependent receptor [Alphaproteobacteria bacterium]
MIGGSTGRGLAFASLLVLGGLLAHMQDAGAQAQPQQSADAQATEQTASSSQPSAEAEPEEIVVKGRFISKGSASAEKLDVPVRDIPFSVSNYTNDFLKSIETVEVADLYRYMDGVQRAGNTAYDLTLRGFKTSANDRNAIMVDGLPGLAVRFGSPPTIGTDHVEVVKGPASLLYGQAQPGGFVNIITKKPSEEQTATIMLRGIDSASIGDELGGYIDADVTGPIDDAHTLLYRLVGEWGYNNTFRTRAYERPLYFMPSLTWRVDDDTSVTGQIEYRSTRTGYDTYLVAPQNSIALLPAITTRYQTPNDYLKEVGVTGTLAVKHSFSDDLTWNTSIRGVDHRDQARGFDVNAILPNNLQVSMRARGQLNIRTYLFGDSNLVGDFDTGPVHNKMIFGFELGRETLNADREQFYNIPNVLNKKTGLFSNALSIYNPDPSTLQSLSAYPLVLPSQPTALNDRYSVGLSKGIYTSDLISLTDEWKVQLGLRFSMENYSQKELRLPGVPTTGGASNALLPLAGVMYQPDKDWTFYTSFSTSFVPPPATAQDIHGLNSFSPMNAQSIEIGAKADLLDGRVHATAAAFKIDEYNVIETFSGGICPSSIGTCSQQTGHERSSGFEFEVNATLVDNWQIIFGYTYTWARVVESNIVQENGALLQNDPVHALHLWTRYDFDEGPLAGFGAGFGATYVGKRVGLLPTATVSQVMPLPTYAIADLALYYKFLDHYDLTFKVNNLFDERYVQSSGFTGNTQILPGDPRSVELTFAATF